jgi:hypothetical protein
MGNAEYGQDGFVINLSEKQTRRSGRLAISGQAEQLSLGAVLAIALGLHE